MKSAKSCRERWNSAAPRLVRLHRGGPENYSEVTWRPRRQVELALRQHTRRRSRAPDRSGSAARAQMRRYDATTLVSPFVSRRLRCRAPINHSAHSVHLIRADAFASFSNLKRPPTASVAVVWPRYRQERIDFLRRCSLEHRNEDFLQIAARSSTPRRALRSRA
jgi:hypothetical protein